MSTIEEQIEYLESVAMEHIKTLTPEKQLNYYKDLKEYQRPKLMRQSFAQDVNLPHSITVEIKNED